jgi:hypothetical protein
VSKARHKRNYRLELGWQGAILEDLGGLQVIQQGRDGIEIDTYKRSATKECEI